MSARYLRIRTPESVSIPWARYLFVAGGILVGLLFAADAYLPKAESKPYHDIDRTVLRVHAPVQQATLGAAPTARSELASRTVATR